MKYQPDRRKQLKSIFTENLSYKIVSLFVALILWLSIIGRRDFVATKEVEVSFLTIDSLYVSGQSSDKVKVKISGAQPLMKKYKEKIENIVIDTEITRSGTYEFDITSGMLNVPKGIRVLNVKPNSIRVEVVEK